MLLLALLQSAEFRPDKELQQAADRQYRFIRKQLVKGTRVIRLAGDDQAAESTLEDYAFIAKAVANYGVYRNDIEAQKLAVNLVEVALDLFHQSGKWLRARQRLIPGDAVSWVMPDGVMESPVSVLLETLELVEAFHEDARVTGLTIDKPLTQDMLNNPYHYVSSLLGLHRSVR